MAGLKPFFLTGANAKVRVNGVTLAYCTNIFYSVVVNHASPKVLGMFEPTSIEPLGYSVTGSFTVIRYVADASDYSGEVAPYKVSEKKGGNGVGEWGGKNDLISRLSDGKAYDAMNPAKLDKAISFDIEIYQKLPNQDQRHVAKIREARITRADFNIANKTAATQVFQFTALYADEDSFLADFSGQGQQWT